MKKVESHMDEYETTEVSRHQHESRIDDYY